MLHAVAVALDKVAVTESAAIFLDLLLCLLHSVAYIHCNNYLWNENLHLKQQVVFL
jgi:hypothetical protein